MLRPLVAGEWGEGVEHGLELFAKQEVANLDCAVDGKARVDWPIFGVVVPGKKNQKIINQAT